MGFHEQGFNARDSLTSRSDPPLSLCFKVRYIHLLLQLVWHKKVGIGGQEDRSMGGRQVLGYNVHWMIPPLLGKN